MKLLKSLRKKQTKEPDAPNRQSAVQSTTAAAHRHAIAANTREFRGQRIEVRSAPAPTGGLALLESEAEQIAAAIAATEGDAVERRSQLARAADAAALRHDYLKTEAERAAQQEDAFRTSRVHVEENLQRLRVSLERLEAGASDALGRLAAIHGAIEDLRFFGVTHAARAKTCAANTKSADAAKSAASAALKSALADLAEVEKSESEIDE